MRRVKRVFVYARGRGKGCKRVSLSLSVYMGLLKEYLVGRTRREEMLMRGVKRHTIHFPSVRLAFLLWLTGVPRIPTTHAPQ